MSGRADRRIVLRRASEVPAELIDEVIADMAARMRGTDEARRCQGLSFTFEIADVEVRTARYAVGARGAVSLSRNASTPSTFAFNGPADSFDSVLRGRQSALGAILGRRIRMHGSLLHLRQIMRMLPAVHRAYNASRDALIARNAQDYDFRF